MVEAKLVFILTLFRKVRQLILFAVYKVLMPIFLGFQDGPLIWLLLTVANIPFMKLKTKKDYYFAQLNLFDL